MSDAPSLTLNATLFQMYRSEMGEPLSAAAQQPMQKGTSDAALKEAADQFESLLLTMMIREMRATVPESALFPDTMANEIYTSLLDEQIAEKMAGSGGIGISRMIFDQLKEK